MSLAKEPFAALIDFLNQITQRQGCGGGICGLMGSSGVRSASGLRGSAWVLVDAKGARVSGGAAFDDPGGQRVEALGGIAVAWCGAMVGGVGLGGVVGAGAANAATVAAPSNNPGRLAYICLMTVTFDLYKSSFGLHGQISSTHAQLPCAVTQFDLGRG